MPKTKNQVSWIHEIFILGVSVYTLVALVIVHLLSVPEEVTQVIHLVDFPICMIFLWDFGLRFYKAESKTNYMKWGWVDLIASIPALEIFRWGRLARLVRILRIIRGVKGSKQVLKWYGSHKGSTIFTFVLLTAMLLMIVSAIIILEFEKGIPESNINTPGDALWWSFVTVTTVGYGDYYPVSLAGRIAAACLMVTGMGLFSSMTVMIGEKILSHQKEEKIESELLIAEIRILRDEVKKMRSNE